MRVQTVHFIAGGCWISGWYLPSRNRAAIVLCHGSDADRRGCWIEAKYLVERGYGALLYDSPGHGESGGRVTWGDPERQALVAALDFLARRPDVDAARIGAFGFSMGGHTLAQVAAADARCQAVVLAAAPSDLVEHLRYLNRQSHGAQLGALAAARWSGADLDGARPIEIVAHLYPRALLVVGGTADEVVPPAMARALHDAAREPKRLWLIEGAGHGDYHSVVPDQYPAALAAFFDEVLRPEPV